MNGVDQRRRRILAGLTATTLTALTMTPALSAPQPPAEFGHSPLRLQGSGVMRLFGLRVYEARLWVKSTLDANHYASSEFALELVYDRRLEGKAIAERSVAEMRRIGEFDEAKAKAWLDLMSRAFPDVAAGDRLVGINDGLGGVRFFHNARLTVETVDAEYARLFFGIWLSPKTSAPALREAILGLTS